MQVCFIEAVTSGVHDMERGRDGGIEVLSRAEHLKYS